MCMVKTVNIWFLCRFWYFSDVGLFTGVPEPGFCWCACACMQHWFVDCPIYHTVCVSLLLTVLCQCLLQKLNIVNKEYMTNAMVHWHWLMSPSYVVCLAFWCCNIALCIPDKHRSVTSTAHLRLLFHNSWGKRWKVIEQNCHLHEDRCTEMH